MVSLHGNGRTCVTCHVKEDGYQLTPARVEARWQALQNEKLTNPDADDPLFRSLDADDHAADFGLLRAYGLVRVNIALPKDGDGNVLVWPLDDPAATSVDVYRAVPSIWNVAITAPYQSDGRFRTLEEQASAALHGHAAVELDPDPQVLSDLSAFERSQFSSDRVALLATAIEQELATLPDTDPLELTPEQQQGKLVFQSACAACHGGPTTNARNATVSLNPSLLDIGISKPVGAFGDGFTFAASPLADKARTWVVAVPGQDPFRRDSSDPGMVLQTGKVEDFDVFDIPSLFGISKTAPYFRDNSAATLTDVVVHYQTLGAALRQNGPVHPQAILDSDIAPLVAYLEVL